MNSSNLPNGVSPEGSVYLPRKMPFVFRYGHYFHLAFVAIGAVAFIAEWPEPGSPIQDYLIAPFGMLFFGGWAAFTLYLRERWLWSFQTDAEGLTVLRRKPLRIAWSQVHDLNLVHAIGGADELAIKLIDKHRKTLVSIRTESLERGGRPLLDELFFRLEAVFERKAYDYLHGDKTWSMPLIKQVARLDDDYLHIEFPKLKKTTIPLFQIRRVEWIPGVIAGAKKGYVLIEHPEGRIEIPQQVRGIQYLIFALKYIAGLGDRVNPPGPPEVTRALDAVRMKQGSANVIRVAGLVMMILPLFHLGKSGLEWMNNRSTETTGRDGTATIVSKEGRGKLRIEYTDHEGKRFRLKTNARLDFFDSVSVGETIPIRYDEFERELVTYKGKAGAGDKQMAGLAGFAGAIILAGAGLFVWSFFRARSGKQIAEELERERGVMTAPLPPLPALPQNAAWDAAASAALAEQEARGTRACANCEATIEGDYYLSGGGAWCAKCKEAFGSGRLKPTIGVRLRAAFVGGMAAFLAAALWATTAILTGYELGLVAILVGLFVGYGVKRGAGDHQGRSIQIIAVILTFLSLAYAMIPIGIHQIWKDPELCEQMSEAFNRGLERGELAGTLIQSSQSTAASQAEALAMAQIEAEIAEIEALEAAIDNGSTTASARLAALLGEDYDDEMTTDTIALLGEDEDELTTGSFDLASLDGMTSTTSYQPGGPIQPGALGSSGWPAAGQPPEFATGSLAGDLFLLLGVFVAALVLGPILIYFVLLFTSPMSILFLGIALWEAWRLNRVEERTFQGPFRPHRPMDFGKADFNL